MNENDLPRFTWIAGPISIIIIRRVGIYGNEEVGEWRPPSCKIKAQDKAIANAICEYLSEQDAKDGES